MCRIIAQFQCSRPRELDSNRSLRFFYVLVVLLNLVGVVKHANYGVADGRALVLDFVGMCTWLCPMIHDNLLIF